MEGQVEVISKCLVTANDVVPRIYRTDLTPWDLKSLLIDYIQKGLFFHKPTPQLQLTDHLKNSLSSALNSFPPLAGRLAVEVNDDGTVSVFIDCNNKGAEFVVAKAAGVTMAQIVESTIVPRLVHSFFPLNKVCNLEGISKPLLGVQVTELDDGYFIGCSMSHTAADASSFWHFFNSWSEISRGLHHLSVPPILQPWFPDNISRPIHLPFDLQKEMSESNSYFTPQPFQERVFHLSKENISKLKAKANSEIGTSESSGPISSLQSYVAHLWRAITRARRIDSSEDVTLYVPISSRWRVNPRLPEGYWGNTIYIKMVRVKAGELLQRGLRWSALQIHEMVNMQSHEEVMEFYQNWVKSPVIAKKNKMILTNSQIIASSPRNNVYVIDFGWGKPIAVRCGMDNKADGKFSLFPGAEQGSIDIEVCLLPQTLHALGNDQEFMEFVSH